MTLFFKQNLPANKSVLKPGVILILLVLMMSKTLAQADCYRLPVTDSLILSPNGYPTNLCQGSPVNIGMATISGYFAEIKKGDGTVKSGEGNGGALSFETTALAPDVEGSYFALSNRYGCPTLFTNHVQLTYIGMRKIHLSGAGVICSGTSKTFTLDSSELNVNYQLYKLAVVAGDPDTAVGLPKTGTGAAITFNGITSTGSYYVRASNTQCTLNMDTIELSDAVSGLIKTAATTSSISFKWNKIQGISGYQYGLSNSASYPATTTFTTDTAVTVNGLTAGQVYYVSVRAQCTSASSATGSWNTVIIYTLANTPNCTAALPLAVCSINGQSYTIPAGEGAWNFAGTFPNNSVGYATPGNEAVLSFTPTVTGYYTFEVLSSPSSEYVDFFYKSNTAGCNNTGWTGLKRLSGSGKMDIGLLTSGVKYYILADKEEALYSLTQTVRICQFTPPCASPTNITVCGTPVTATTATGTGIWDFGGTFPNNSAGYSTPGKELVYTFTAPTTGPYTLEVTSTSGSVFVDYLYKPVSAGCSNTGWTGIKDVGTTGTWNVGILQSGVQYYLLLDRESTSGTSTQTFKICPLCTNAPLLSLCTPVTATLGSGNGFWNFDTILNSTPGREALYRFTPSTTGFYYFQTTAGGFDYMDALYKPGTGGCVGTGWTPIGRVQSAGFKPIGNLTAGVEYYFLIDRESIYGSLNLSFQICMAPAPNCSSPANVGVCSTAVVNIPAGYGSWDFQGLYPTNGTSHYTPGIEQLFTFTPGETGYYNLSVSSTSGTVSYLYKPFTAGCSSTGWTGIGSFSYTDTANIGLLQAGTQYYFVADNEYNTAASQTFKICKVNTPDCNTATVINAGDSIAATITAGTGAWSYNSYAGLSKGKELFYKFTPAVTGVYYLKINATDGNGSINYFIKTVSTGCNNSGWKSIANLSQPGSILLDTLQGGTPYYILLDSYTPASIVSQSFTIKKVEPPVCSSARNIFECVTVADTIPAGLGGWFLPGPPPYNFTTNGNEQVYRFTPAVSGNYKLELLNRYPAQIFEFYYKPETSGCNANGWNNIGEYSAAATKTIGFLQAGTSYLILLDKTREDIKLEAYFRVCLADSVSACNNIIPIQTCSNISLSMPEGYGNWNFAGVYPQNSVGNSTPGKEIIYRFTPTVTSYYYLDLISTSGYSYTNFLLKPASAGCGPTGWKGIARFGSYNTEKQNMGILQAGTEYYLLVDNTSGDFVQQVFMICYTPAPVCTAAIQITECNKVSATIPEGFGAWDMSVGSKTTSSGFVTRGKELLYSFTPSSTGYYYLEVDSTNYTGSYVTNNFIDYLIKADDGTCSESGWRAIGELRNKGVKDIGMLQAGTRYFILLDNELTISIFHRFRICKTDAPNCATPIVISACSPTTVSIGSGVGAWDFKGTYPNNSVGFSTIGKEMLYRFTPAVSGNYTFEILSANGHAINYFYKSANSCDNLGWKGIGSYYAYGGKNIGPLLAGTEYYILADNQDTLAETQSLRICISETPNCGSNKILNVGTTILDTIPQGLGGWDFESASTANVAGKSTPGKERFYKFTPSTTGVYFLRATYTSGVSFLYKPANTQCTATGWTRIGSLNVPYDSTEVPIGNLLAGVEYYIVADNEFSGASNFQITILESIKLCPNGNVNFTMPTITQGSVTYNWQVDAGNGFTDITDNGFYSGTETTTLYISGAPSSFYGYRYRGVGKAIGGFGSFTQYTDFRPLQFVSTWTGNTNAWNSPGNWSCNIIPDQNTDVIILAGTANNPRLQNSAAVRSITVKPGATVTVATGMTLEVKGK